MHGYAELSTTSCAMMHRVACSVDKLGFCPALLHRHVEWTNVPEGSSWSLRGKHAGG